MSRVKTKPVHDIAKSAPVRAGTKYRWHTMYQVYVMHAFIIDNHGRVLEGVASDACALKMPDGQQHTSATWRKTRDPKHPVVPTADPRRTSYVVSAVLPSKITLDGFSKVREPKPELTSPSPLDKTRKARASGRPRVTGKISSWHVLAGRNTLTENSDSKTMLRLTHD